VKKKLLFFIEQIVINQGGAQLMFIVLTLKSLL
jgi:hypothetical protein